MSGAAGLAAELKVQFEDLAKRATQLEEANSHSQAVAEGANRKVDKASFDF